MSEEESPDTLGDVTEENSTADETVTESEEGSGFSKYFTPDRSGGAGAFLLSLVMITWVVAGVLMAAAMPLSLTAIILLYILSAITFCFCPCLGLAGAAGTTAVWTIGLSFCALVVTFATVIGGGLSLLATMASFRDREVLATSAVSLVGHVILFGILIITDIAKIGFGFFEILMS